MAEQRSLIRKHIEAASDLGWITGESFSDYSIDNATRYGRRATYSKDSIAVDPFRKLGVIQAGYGSGLTVAGIINQISALKTYIGQTQAAFALDIRNNVYYIDTVNNNASIIQSLNATTVTNSPVGLEIHRDALYAAVNVNATTARLAKYSPLFSASGGASWNLSYNMSLIAFVLNPKTNANLIQLQQILLSWKGNLYAFHQNQCWFMTGQAASPAVFNQGCTFPDQMIAKTAIGFGNQIAIGCSENIIDGNYKGKVMVYFYDGFSLDWEKEVPLPDQDIRELRYDGNDLFAFGTAGVWRYDGVGFERLNDIDTNVNHGGSDLNNGQLFFVGNNVVRAYGRPVPYIEKAWTRPMTGAGNGGIARWITATKLYVASNDGNVYRYASNTFEGSATVITRFFDGGAGQNFYVRAVKIGYEKLVSGDGFDIKVEDENKTTYVIGSVSFANDGTNNPVSKLITEQEFSTAVPLLQRGRLNIAPTSGNPKFVFFDLLLETVKEV